MARARIELETKGFSVFLSRFPPILFMALSITLTCQESIGKTRFFQEILTTEINLFQRRDIGYSVEFPLLSLSRAYWPYPL